jgi:histidinol dehydrogenase
LDRGRKQVFDPELKGTVEAIVADVAANGDKAVCRATARWDNCSLIPDQLRVSAAEIEQAEALVSGEVRDAIGVAIDHVRRFNEHLIRGAAEWRVELDPGLTVGEKRTPIASAGLFVPSGKGSYPSVLVHLGTPAVVAKVPEIAVVVPPQGPDGSVDAAVLYAAQQLGLNQIFRANGPAGVAALALGTERFPRMWKVLGPGSPPVAASQIECQRHGCSTMMLLGPSESLILADDTADPRLLAADLLNEAEHGPDSTSVFVTASRALVGEVQSELESQIAELPEPRREYASAALGRNGGAAIVADLEQGIEVANRFAPEHMQVVVADEEEVVRSLVHAGEILLGQFTPISAANYVFGVPAVLPTSGFAQVSSGVTVEAFLKKTSVARATKAALNELRASVLALAEYENFPAHAAAVRARNGEETIAPSERGEIA